MGLIYGHVYWHSGALNAIIDIFVIRVCVVHDPLNNVVDYSVGHSCAVLCDR